MLVVGIDGATWKVIDSNLHDLPTFAKLKKEAKCSTITLAQKPWSPSVWCSMFSGKTPEEHGHKDFVQNGRLVRREDIPVQFIWDILHAVGIPVKVLNVPFVIPPYCFNIRFEPVAQGLPIEEHELLEEIQTVTSEALEVLSSNKPELFIVVYTALDRLSHLHWGEPILIDYYKKIDAALGQLLEHDEEFIVISDHGFCSYDEAPIRTLPKRTPKGEIKGDHHPEAILITKNINFSIDQPEDVFYCLKKRFLGL